MDVHRGPPAASTTPAGAAVRSGTVSRLTYCRAPRLQTGVRYGVGIRVASSAEREPLWAQMARIFPLYDEYAQKTDRVIPIVLLAPQD